MTHRLAIDALQIMPCDQINEVYRLLDGTNDAGIRYVLDIGNTLNEGTAAKCTAAAANPAVPEVMMTICGTLGELCRLCCCFKCR